MREVPLSTNLLARLDTAIAAAPDPTTAACLRADRAAMLARLGHRGQARAEIAALRGIQAQRPSPRVDAWLCLAEGLADFFEELEPSARTHIQAAYTRSLEARDPALHALAAAWLAHLNYVQRDTAGLVRHVVQALHLAGPEDHDARARACLVVAEAWHSAGRFDLALPWYRSARLHASQLGDEATLSALMHNMAWLRAHEAREKVLFGAADPDQTRQALMGAESTERFDTGVGTGALHALLPILRAQIHTLLGEYDQALALYDSTLAQALQEGLRYLEPCFRADIAWCHLQLGHRSEARQAAEAAWLCIDDTCADDDRAYALKRLALVFEALGEAERAKGLEAQSQAHLSLHRDYQAQLRVALQRALTGLKP